VARRRVYDAFEIGGTNAKKKMINSLKSTLSRNLTNAIGWKTDRKIVVIESDDWGSIRMPDKNVMQQFISLGYNLNKNPYCRYDTLANSADLSSLFEVLRRYTDEKGTHPKFTFNTVMGNPEFDKIKATGFNDYFYEPFTKTIEDYYPKENVFNLWKQAIGEGLMYPQFHGREHVNVPIWLNQLKNSNPALNAAFDLHFWGIPKESYGENRINIQAAFSSADEEHLDFYKNNIMVGTKMFENIFGFKSDTFIANNYTFPKSLYKVLHDSGIRGIQSMRYHKIPNKNGNPTLKPVYTGMKNSLQQTYTVRNCVFEPSQMPNNYDNVEICLNEISNSFFWKKPAILTSHRINFIGSIEEDNRKRNLKLLEELIQKIFKRWPDVEFMSSNELIKLIDDN
jgi:hypothetical protein